MLNIIKSALYKLSKDWTFRITLIIGVVLAVFMNLLYLGIGASIESEEAVELLCNGQSFFINSLVPTQNFGLTIPINLIVFTIGEFNCGTIRNKIIAGHKKSSIYLSLLLIGVIFTLSLMLVYFGLSVGIASIIGGFDVNGSIGTFTFRPEYLWKYSLMAIAVYIFITAFAIFTSVTFRTLNICLPIVIIGILMMYFAGLATTLMEQTRSSMDGNIKDNIQMLINPMFMFAVLPMTGGEISPFYFAGSIIGPILWTVIFTGLGLYIFKVKDVK